MPFKDKEISRAYHTAYSRKWNKDHPERVAEYQKRSYSKNLEKHARRAKSWREKNPERHKENWKRWFYGVKLKKQYGLSVEQFDRLLSEQKHCCAICRNPFTDTRNRHVDHCHSGNYVRGILCSKCNLAIGLLQDSPIIALEAAHYLLKGELFSNPS